MSSIFNPSAGAVANANWELNGSVARLVQLPEACKAYYGAVVFCHEDKKFYECRNIVTETEDYYRWIAVTDGSHRMIFIPVEKLVDKEISGADAYTPSWRTNSFDAVASALNELAYGFIRYNIDVKPLCYKRTYDTKVVSGVDYYRFNNHYDRADVVKKSEDEITPVVGKPYFYLENGVYVTQFFSTGESFVQDVVYYVSSRPFFVKATDLVAGSTIEEVLFEVDSSMHDMEHLTIEDLMFKYNEIVDLINMTGTHLHVISQSEMNAGTGINLLKVCEYVNILIDEVNPFTVPWNNMLNRVEYLETIVKQYGSVPEGLDDLVQRVGTLETDAVELQGQIDRTNERIDNFAINLPVIVSKGNTKYTMDFVEGAGNRMLTCKAHSDQSVTPKYVFPMTIIRNGVVYYLDFDDSDPSVVEKSVYARQVT